MKKKTKKPSLLKNTEVKNKEKELKNLIKKQESVEQEIKDLLITFKKKSPSDKDIDRFLDGLPLKDLRDLQDFQRGKKKDFSLDILKLRTKLKNEQMLKFEELIKLDEQIKETKTDLLLAKINCVLVNLDNDTL